MDNSPPLPRSRRGRLRVFALAAFVAALGLNLASCGVNGDFNLVNRDLVRDDIHDWVGRRESPGLPIPRQLTGDATFQLTDDERQLRDLAYPLLEPPYNRQKYHSVASEYGFTPQTLRESADRTVYFNHLLGLDDRSPSSRYARLIDDIRNDITRMPEFFEAAGRVLDLDDKRLRSMAIIHSLSAVERAQAKARVRENAHIVAIVRTSLIRRAISYRFALERLIVMSPMRQAAEADRVLSQMDVGIARYQHGTPPTWTRPQSLADSR